MLYGQDWLKRLIQRFKNNRKPHFQLVIVKATEKQFRITSINDNGYYSDKYDKIFTEDEIEDFDVYWACKD